MDSIAIQKKLIEAGIYVTPQRQTIAQILLSKPQHMTAEQVHDRIKAQNKAYVSRATVYNTLNLFVQKGLLKEVYVDANCTFYDSNTSMHSHFYHEDSGELTDIDALELEQFKSLLPGGTELKDINIVIRIRDQQAQLKRA